MIAPELFKTMAHYNRWMNDRVYQICDGIPDEVRKEDRGAFFKSMHGTLNHLLLTDRTWLSRFGVKPFRARSLDEELYADFSVLCRERRHTDEDIERWAAALTQEKLAERSSFEFGTGENKKVVTYPFWHVVLQLFNHQTHHRGQLTTLMMQAGYDPGVTDILKLPGTPLYAPEG